MMNSRAMLTISSLLMGVAINMIVETVLRQQKEISSLQNQVEQQRLTIQELVVKETEPVKEEE
jgi:hypothetical protein